MLSVAEILQPELLLAVLLLPLQGFRVDLVTHHVLGQCLGVGVLHQSLGHHVAVPEDGVAVADLHDLTQLVADEDDAHPLLFQSAHHGKDPLNLRICQGGGGLVHDDDGGILHQSPGNLYNLLVAGIQIPDHGVGVQIQIHFLKQLPGFALHQSLVQQNPLLGQVGDEHILIDGQVVDEVQLLMDEADARIQRVHRSGKVHRFSVQRNGAAVSRKDAAQNVHQGRLSGAVFSQQRADLPRCQGEIHFPKHPVGTEGLVNFLH